MVPLIISEYLPRAASEYLGYNKSAQKLPILLSKKTTKRGGGGQKSPILRRHSLWTAPKGKYVITTCQKSSKPNSKECVKSKKSPQKNRMKHQKVHEVQKVRR